jgi:molecular chaperone HtpG
VQNNRSLKQLGKTIRSRIIRELKKLAESEVEKYHKFWGELGRTFKEGIASDPEAKEDVLPLLRYYSSKSGGALTSLDQYLKQLQAGQNEIYYVLGDDEKSVARSPHLDPFKARNLEVLYWVDPFDVLITPMLTEYQGKKFKNIDDAEIALPEMKEDKTEEKDETPEAEFYALINRCANVLGERVTEVRPSKVLKDNPVRLVAPKDEQNREMQRINRLIDKAYKVPKRILELNRQHPLIANLARMLKAKPDAELINLTIEQLYDSALVQEGLHPNPAEMLPRIQQLMTLAAAKE